MRKLIAITHLTLDGIMQAPGGPEEDPSGGFTHGGWAMSFGDEVVHSALKELMSGEFDLLLGRRTYQIWEAYWPHAGDNFIANAFNKATKYVASNSLDRFDWMNTRGLKGDVAAKIRRLKKSKGPDLHLWGSSNLLQTLIAADVIDEFRTWVCPVILGKGKRLFEKGVPPRAFTLMESRRGTKGVLLNTYRLAGPITGRAKSVRRKKSAAV